MDCSVIVNGKKVSLENFISSIKGEKPKTPDIKTNVRLEKLFDSNPELANQVYEALGFKTKPDVILPIGKS